VDVPHRLQPGQDLRQQRHRHRPTVPTLAGRAPYQVGEAQARPNLGDTSGDIANTTYLPDADRYTTLVDRRGSFSGYEVTLSQHLPLQGRGAADQKCAFSADAAARIGGNFSHNLGRKIAERHPWVRFSGDDVYAYCTSDGRPIVVIPLKRQVGFWVVTEKPAGVALYDGSSGDITFVTDATNIPGPSYPISLAGKQRDSVKAMNGFGNYFWGRSGWEVTSDDVNSGNNAEFTLATADDHQPVYVTPLTGRGSATAVSVVSVISARMTGRQLAPLTVHKLSPVWVSPKALVDRIKADYQDLPNWQNITVYEVIPTGGNTWVATLGTGQNILYRVTGTGNLTGDKPTCLLNAAGQQIRCGSVANTGTNGVGGAYGPGTNGATPGNLSGLTNEQLAALQQQLAALIACRLAGTCAVATPSPSPSPSR
jgi:hypothetical protein